MSLPINIMQEVIKMTHSLTTTIKKKNTTTTLKIMMMKGTAKMSIIIKRVIINIHLPNCKTEFVYE